MPKERGKGIDRKPGVAGIERKHCFVDEAGDPTLNLPRQAFQEPLSDLRTVVLLELRPLLRLSGEDEIHNVARTRHRARSYSSGARLR